MQDVPYAGTHWLPINIASNFRKSLEQPHGIATVFFVAAVEQLQARGKITPRVLLLGENAFYLCSTNADIVRNVHISELTGIVLVREGWFALLSKQGDFVMRIVSSIHDLCTVSYLSGLLRTLYSLHTSSAHELSLRTADCDPTLLVIDLDLQLAPPPLKDSTEVSLPYPLHIIPYDIIATDPKARDVLDHISLENRTIVEELRSRLNVNIVTQDRLDDPQRLPEMKLFRSTEWVWDWVSVQGPPAIYNVSGKCSMPAVANNPFWYASQLGAVSRTTQPPHLIQLAPQRITPKSTTSTGTEALPVKNVSDAGVQVTAPPEPRTPSKEEIAYRKLMENPFVEEIIFSAMKPSHTRYLTPQTREQGSTGKRREGKT